MKWLWRGICFTLFLGFMFFLIITDSTRIDHAKRISELEQKEIELTKDILATMKDMTKIKLDYKKFKAKHKHYYNGPPIPLTD